jgi:hypothetical protein
MRVLSTSLSCTAAVAAAVALASCGEFGFPTMSDATCGVSGFACHTECRVTPMPAEVSDPRAVSYHIGPTSCPDSYVAQARRQADAACHARGLAVASSQLEIKDQPPVPPLAPARSVTFHCQG